MQTHPALRPRTPGQKVAGIGSLRWIMNGLFGSPTAPNNPLRAAPGTGPNAALYHYHQGDVFLPGTGNWAVDPAFDIPLTTIWGSGGGAANGFFYPPNQFSVRQPPPVDYGLPYRVAGVGGIIPGQIFFSPLAENPLSQSGE